MNAKDTFFHALHSHLESDWLVSRDGDGVPDGFDKCVDLPNGEQADADDDSVGTM